MASSPARPPAPAPPPVLAPEQAGAGERSRRWAPLLALTALALAAAILRLVSLGDVALDPFYDAAVRSMSLSWHNFFFGAFEPGGSVSIDKPPVDLWLQVASVKLLGFGPVSLKLPQALAGTAAVPLVFVALRRVFGALAALASALTLAVLPISVLTARSDTMDAVMMVFIVAALGLAVHAAVTGRPVWLYLAGAMLGLAFNVKLLEALIPVPAIAVLAWLGLPGSRIRRALHIAGSGAVLVAVSLSWLTATLAFPAHERPFAIGSTNGSAWNAAFVFNGYDRIVRPARLDPAAAATSPSASTDPTGPGHDAVLDHLPIRPPSATRLFDRAGPLSGRRLGFVLVVAFALGVPALLATALARRRRRREQGEPPGAADGAPPGSNGRRRAEGAEDEADGRLARARRATAIALLLWLAGGTVLFSVMARLHPRYVEAFDPAVAAAAGIGIVWAASGRARRGAALALAVVTLASYAWYLKGGPSAVGWVTVAGAAGALAAVAIARRHARAALVPTLVAAFALPISVSVAIVADHSSDAGHAGYMRPDQLAKLSSYLLSHRRGARYEVTVSSATQAGALVVKDAQPVLVLTTYDGRTLVSVGALRRLVSRGAVRYALLGGRCHPGDLRTVALCSAPARWISAHATDVSHAAGLRRGALLWRLPTR